MEFIQVVSQSRRVVFSDCEDDAFSRTDFLPWGKLFIILPSQSVELLHHLSVGVFVGPFALEFRRIVGLVIHLGTLSKDDGNTSGKLVWNKVAVVKCLLDRKGKIRLPDTALIELECISLNVS